MIKTLPTCKEADAETDGFEPILNQSDLILPLAGV